MAADLAVGFLNCYNRLDCIQSAVTVISSKNPYWILGINEGNLRGAEGWLSNSQLIVHGNTSKGRTYIITPMRKWKQITTNLNNEIVSIEIGLGNRNLVVSCIYLSPSDNTVANETIKEFHDLVRANRTKQHILLGDVNAVA